MLSKKPMIALCLTASLLLGTSAFADNQPVLSGWAVPDRVNLEAVNQGDTILETKTELQWTPDQLRGFPVKGQQGIGRFFPSLVYKADAANELQPQVMMSNLPGAKFFRTAADEGGGEQIKVSVLGTAYLQPDKPYMFYTGWRFTGADKSNPQVTLSSLQEFDQGARGTMTELDETKHELTGIRWKEAKPVGAPSNENIAAFNKDPFFFPREEDEEAVVFKRQKGYTDIDSKEALDRYKSNAAKLLKDAPDCCSPIRYAITFKKNVSMRDVEQLAKEYNLNITQYYAAGKKEKQEEDEYTVSWFDSKWERPLYLVRGFYSFNVTELEGTAGGYDLKRISSGPEVDVVDIEVQGKLPTGVHWLNKRFSESK